MRNLEETVEQIKRDRENRILSLWRTYLGSFEREIPIGTFRTFEAGYRAGRTDERRGWEEKGTPGDHVEEEFY